jgi:hypothetical protein
MPTTLPAQRLPVIERTQQPMQDDEWETIAVSSEVKVHFLLTCL